MKGIIFSKSIMYHSFSIGQRRLPEKQDALKSKP